MIASRLWPSATSWEIAGGPKHSICVPSGPRCRMERAIRSIVGLEAEPDQDVCSRFRRCHTYDQFAGDGNWLTIRSITRTASRPSSGVTGAGAPL